MRLRLPFDALYWSWRIAAALVQRLPARLVYSGAVVGGEFAYLVWRRRREITKSNFAIVLGRPAQDPEVARVARRAFRNFGKYLTEIMRFPSMGRAELHDLVKIDPVSFQHLQFDGRGHPQTAAPLASRGLIQHGIERRIDRSIRDWSGWDGDVGRADS